MLVNRALALRNAAQADTMLTLDNPAGWPVNLSCGTPSRETAMKLSAVYGCVEILSNSMSKLPRFVMDGRTRERLPEHPLMDLLTVRPNEAMTPSVCKKLIECNRLLTGNGYQWIVRDPLTARPRELIPLISEYVTPWQDENGTLWYICTYPKLGRPYKLRAADVLHYKGYSRDGITGISVLRHAAEVIATARAAQTYENSYYTKGTQLPGILSVEADLSRDDKDAVRDEWAKLHAGADNAFRVGILDKGMKYQPIGLSNRDSQFVESKAVSVEDISRFFGVPLYKLNAGKQSYSSNEQNAIEYLGRAIHPNVTQCEEEDSYKLLFPSELRRGLEVRWNMMAELKSDNATRGAWYKNMREVGAFSANDIRALEDMPDIAGGDDYYASLNYVPLELFRQLSISRNVKEGDRK